MKKKAVVAKPKAAEEDFLESQSKHKAAFLFETWKAYFDVASSESQADLKRCLEDTPWFFSAAVSAGISIALEWVEEDLRVAGVAGPILEKIQRAAKKGGAARKAKVAPTHKAIQRRFRQLRKESPKKTVRYLRVAEEFGMSDRNVARIVEGID